MKKSFLSLLMCGFFAAQAQNEVISLDGEWQFQIDRQEVGQQEKWYDRAKLDDSILLPGSMAERLKGDDPTVNTQWTGSLYDSSFYFNPALEKYRKPGKDFSLPFFLTPSKHYKGVAWYVKEVDVPASWAGKEFVFTMERPHVKTSVWVNGSLVGTQNTLCVPHVYSLGKSLKPGQKNLIAVCVDNTLRDVPVGQDSHSVTDQTQGNWNGIVGDIQLSAHNPVRMVDDGDFHCIEVYPDIARHSAGIRVAIANPKAKNVRYTLALTATPFNCDSARMQPRTLELKNILLADSLNVLNLQMEGLDNLWDEFSPNLYRLDVCLLANNGKKLIDKQTTTFGMREIHIEGRWIYVNGRKTMLRGTVENADFPLTGYVPTDTASWMRVFRICKQYGLNHMRFHSYCPPEAAFIAADMTGFYLQPEGPSWPNHGIKLGRKDPIDTYLLQETRYLTREYGNHPSFTMLSAGNEPAGNWVPWASDFVHYWRKHDQRRIYTGFSVGGGWAWQPHNEFHVKAGVRGLTDWDKNLPGTMSDFRGTNVKGVAFDTVSQPYICHELGQWCAFPDFKEIESYTGVMKAKNFEMFRDILAQNDMAEMGEKFLMASGKLQALCYKYELEKLRRTRGYAGYQMLALNDYSGQGTALEGVLNVFFDNKGYVNDSIWRQSCAPVVVTMRTPKFVYSADDTLHCLFEVSNFGQGALKKAQYSVQLCDADGHNLETRFFARPNIELGECLDSLSVSFAISQLGIQKAQKLLLRVAVAEGANLKKSFSERTVATNQWNVWVYPTQSLKDEASVYVTDTLDDKARTTLMAGGDVLIMAGGKITYGRDVKQYFTPVFWNTSWFKMRPPHTTGLYVQNQHPVFRDFPTDYHSDLQWWELVNRTQVMLFTDFPKGFQPLVQSIDTWFISRKIGVLFEARVGKGRLMMTTMDLNNDLDHRLVARQMRQSILSYMQSDEFKPAYSVEMERVSDLFTKLAPKVDSYTSGTPDELKPGYEKPKK